MKGDKREKIVLLAASLAAKGNFSAIRVLGAAGEDAAPFLPLLGGIAGRHPGLMKMAHFLQSVSKIIGASTVRQIVTASATVNAGLWKKSKYLIFPGASVLTRIGDAVFAKGKIAGANFRHARQRGKDLAFPVFDVALDGGMRVSVNILEPKSELWLLRDVGEWPAWAASFDPPTVKAFGEERVVKGVVIAKKDDAVLMKVRHDSRLWVVEVPSTTLMPCAPPPWGFPIAARLSSLTEGDVVKSKDGPDDLFVVQGFSKGQAVLGQLRCESNRKMVGPQALKYVGRYDAYRGVSKEPSFRSESLA